MPQRLLCGATLFCALIAAASAQVTLANYTFEGDTIGTVPAGWLTSGSNLVTLANPSASGVNTSARVTGTANWNNTDSVLINLTGYTSGYTFTLAFDLYDVDSTNDHGFLTGYGVSGSSVDAWPIGSSLVNSGATMFDDLTATSTWQHFSFDFTTSVNTYLSSHPGQAANFAIMFFSGSMSSGARPYLDNVTFTATAIPEPSAWAALAGVAALGFAGIARRRKRA